MIIGTAGHVNHGKTTLVKALTGVDCDRLEEERRRGMTIELGFAAWKLPDKRMLSVVDVPGHARLVHTMATGALGVKAVLLVVAADEGLMPQTREHLGVCRVLGIEHGVVAVTRTDRVDDLPLALEIIGEEILDTHLCEAPLVPVCAPKRQGLDELSRTMAEVIPSGTGAERDLPLLLPVDRAFSVRGFGTVVTGSLIRGRIRDGETALLCPSGASLRVRGLHVHGQQVRRAEAGHRLALNLPDTHPKEIERGSFIAQPGQISVGRVFDAEIMALPHLPKPLHQADSLGYVCGARRAKVRVRADAPIHPGEVGTARIYLDRDVPLCGGLRFILRGPSHHKYGAVIGGGRIIDAGPPRRRTAETRRQLVREADPETLMTEAGRRGLLPQSVGWRLGIQPLPSGPLLFADSVVQEACQEMIQTLRAWQKAHPDDPGMAAGDLRLGKVGEPALALALKLKRAVQEGPFLRTPEHKGNRGIKDQALAARLLPVVEEGGLTGPKEDELRAQFSVSQAEIRRSLELLEKAHRIVRCSGFCFAAAAAAALRRKAAQAVLAGEQLPVAWLKEEAKVSRKHAIPLWTWLDRSGVTQRDGDVRVAGPSARTHAGPQSA